MHPNDIRRSPYLRLIPLGIFLMLALLMASGLFNSKPAPMVSPLVGKEMPNLNLPQAQNTARTFGLRAIRNEVAIVSLFASWCEPCVAEHTLLARLAQESGARIYGIAWRDRQEKVLAWLGKHGNPYHVVMLDELGLSTAALGVHGLPETYVIAPSGVIAHKHSGPLTEEDLQQTILPLVARMKNAK